MVLLVFLESENLSKIRLPNWEICLTGHDVHMAVWGYHLGSMVVWVSSWEVGRNGRRMALKLVGEIILVSMVTNHSHQTHPTTIKPTLPCSVLCGEEHSGVMFMAGG